MRVVCGSKVVLLAAAVLVVGGCGEGKLSEQSTTAPSPSEAVTSGPVTNLPTPGSGPRIEPGPEGTLPPKRPLTVSGKVTRAPNGGCLLLVSAGTSYELHGPAERLPETGQRVTVFGQVDQTLPRHCGGVPLVVDSFG
ncbi:MAG: hypothetical protein ACRDQA_05150 [Nocardioidaceae bacterium]